VSGIAFQFAGEEMLST